MVEGGGPQPLPRVEGERITGEPEPDDGEQQRQVRHHPGDPAVHRLGEVQNPWP